MIEIKKIHSNLLPLFVKLPFALYKDCSYWVPPIIKDEIALLHKNRNAFLKNCDIQYFMAYKDGKIVGRVAAIINWDEVNTQKRKKIRFGWLDFIDDCNVCEKLLTRVADFGKAHGMTYMEGPIGISNLDKSGMLTEGFDIPGKITTHYNYHYYPKIMKKLGYKISESWIEYAIEVPEDNLHLHSISELITKRYKLKTDKISSKKEMLSCIIEMISVINASFKNLPTYTPIKEDQVNHYKNKYLSILHPDFVSFVFNQEGKMIAFAITFPSLFDVFRKLNGRIGLFGYLHLAKGLKKCKSADLSFIGVLPEWQNKGIAAILFSKIIKSYQKKGITKVEVGPGLLQNSAIHALWRKFDAKIIRKRLSFKKDI